LPKSEKPAAPATAVKATKSTERRGTKSAPSAAGDSTAGRAVPAASVAPSARLSVRKTYKLYVGGAFPRSESGRTYLVDGDNVALASRKDARDAVVAARKAQPKWAAATAYNRGQVVYRIAEMVEARRGEFVALGVPAAEVAAAVDRLIWYAGWSDKIAQVTGNANPVAGPFFNLSAPEPTGVVGVIAPASLLGLVSVVAPAIVTGNTVIVISDGPQVAITLAEVLATSDVPGGVVNILTGRAAEIAPWLASHDDVNALDLTGVTDTELATDLERAAAGTLKRVLRPPAGGIDLTADPGVRPMTAFLETKTVWHPKGF
jgi:acyl-CoA reductase-like NAD-dependent aldehyde dehydrogenase